MSAEPERRLTTEKLGDFFLIEWSAANHWADFKVFSASGVLEDGQMVFTNYDTKHTDDDLRMSGFIKWDGCSHLTLDNQHLCGLPDWELHVELLQHLWNRAYELMGREPEDGPANFYNKPESEK